ncbi:MAG: SIS domain-containing protein [Clostridiales bacterium]|nr:SIS domain-containing protein [Clostridiales bacterium]
MSSKDFTPEVRSYLDEVSGIVGRTDEKAIASIAEILLAAWKNGNTVFTAGNGGSSATASHMVNDLTKGCAVLGRNGFKAVCLSDSSAVVTCLANDFCYEDAFKIELKTLASKGDVLCVFTGSGNSENIVRACEYARSAGITVVGFLGRDGGKTLPLCDAALVAPTDCMEQIEDIHMVAEHALATVLRERLKDVWGLEVIFPPRGHDFKFALFDFDGTLSLIREGWQKIMIPYFCEELSATPEGCKEDPADIEKCVTEFVDMLTGKQTIYQCMALADEINKRGGKAEDPMVYKNEYIRRLMEKIKDRREGLADGTIAPEELLVRGSVPLLEGLLNAGIRLYCASGTDQPQVREEAALLGLDKYFGENIYGALDEHATACTKELVIKRLLAENNLDGSELLSFGDGFVEIELVSRIGGYPIAVATDESRKFGIDGWKRDRLVGAGAGAVIPDFEEADKIVSFIVNK